MKAYSDDLREKVLKALQSGQLAKDVAARFYVGISFVYKISRRYKETGSYKALPRPGAPRKLKDEDIQNREDVKQAREKWKIESIDILPERVVCLDESNIKTSMVRCYGRGKRGERVKGYIPDASWGSLSILSSLRIDGSTEAIVYEGGLDGEFFKQCVK